MKKQKRLATISLLFLGFFSSCTPRYLLRPSGKNIIEMNHKDYVFIDNKECRLEATYKDEKIDSTLIEFRLTSKLKKPILLSHQQFRLEGAPLTHERVEATDPLKRKLKLSDDIVNIKKRGDTKTWTGVEEIHDYLVTTKSEESIEKSKEDLSLHKKEEEKNKKKILVYEKELSLLKNNEFQKATISSLKSESGILIFETSFIKEGQTFLILDHPDCKLQVPFEVRVSKSWN